MNSRAATEGCAEVPCEARKLSQETAKEVFQGIVLKPDHAACV